ncbi:beta-fructofuranosidase, insoluble isoenzyme 3-like [Zingiber officinale]|uniref:beta-fructofuranosidase, insoluble isoenzyme 3-like n=1 Tax=Zingiber officinale TaxID=94328 RepID=UPI001C4D46F1|nr:beta-fructofuranosidase, insoluble isoenzyme 3-like [Zingiber officinale]
MAMARRILGRLLAIALVLAHWWAAAEASHVVYESLQSVTAAVVSSELRPRFHFQSQRNWLNDPNGPMYYNGLYHLFYQYNPKGSVWGNIVWAHSVSTDLINWKALEPAIYPSKSFDINGCWSGSATILPGNRPVIMYTGVDPQNRQVQNVAYPKNLSDPYLREWVKPDFNPVIAPESGVNASAFRDPTTAWRGVSGHWKLVIGSKRDTRGEVILYRSRDFVRWVKAKHSLHTATGTGMWECPDLYPVSLRGRLGLDTSTLGGAAVKHVLKVSLDVTRYEYYTVGTYDHIKDRYVPDGASPDGNTGLRYDYGNFYASKTFFDNKKNRRILWGWTNESDSVNDDIAKGWAGIQAIPRAVWLAGNGRQLIQWPVEELESLRSKHIVVQNKQVPSGGLLEVKGIDSSQADVEVTFQVSGLEKAEAFHPSWAADAETLCGRKRADVKGGVGPFGLHVLASANMEEKTAVFFRIFKAEHKYKVLLCHDPTRSSLRPNLYKPTFAGFVDVDIARTGKISLRTLIDHSVVESFGAGGMTCITSRVYPSLALRRDAHLFAFNNGIADVKVSTLNAWEMRRPLMNGA